MKNIKKINNNYINKISIYKKKLIVNFVKFIFKLLNNRNLKVLKLGEIVVVKILY